MRRILFVTSSRIGDAVLSTGLLEALHQRHPDARFTVACGKVAAPLFEPCPHVERVIAMVKRRRAGHWLDLWRQTVGTWWSLVVDLRGSGLGWVIPTAKRRIIRSSWTPEHRLVHLSRLLDLPQPQAPRLWSGPEHIARAAELIPDGGPVLALGPTANWGGKQWPAENFTEAARRLTAPGALLAGARIAILGGPGEQDAAEPVLASIPPERRIDLVGTIDLPQAFACLRRCSLYIGNDSGLMHIAAAAGIPTLGLFGPSSEVFYAPWGAKTAALRGPRSFEDICHAPGFDHRSQASLMNDLAVERVVEAAEGLWRSTTS